MRMPLAATAFLVALSIAGASAFAQPQSPKEQDIRALISLTKMDRIAAQTIELMMPQTRQLILAMRPDISRKHVDQLLGETAEMLRQSAPWFIEAMIPLYENASLRPRFATSSLSTKRPPVGSPLQSCRA